MESLILLFSLLLSLPAFAQKSAISEPLNFSPLLAQNDIVPDPLKISFKNNKPLPQAEPAAIALALKAGPTTPQPPPLDLPNWLAPGPEVQTQTGIVTGTADGIPLHAEIAWPKNPPAGLMPAVIWVHGGAWVGGEVHPNKAAWLATRGYFTASVEYRLAKVSHTDGPKWPSQIQDCKLAVRWLRANAARYHVDPDHIGIWGESAGGHLVSCVGTLDDPALEGNGGYPGVSSKVQAVCDWNGPEDLLREGGQLFSVAALSDTTTRIAASPLYNIKRTQPPFLVMQGDKDPSVPYKESVDFVVALLKAGAPVEFISVHNAQHGLSQAPGFPPVGMSMPQILGRIAEFFDKYLKP